MKPLSEQDHYETLEIPSSASPQDVERAYQLARSTYAEDSLAGHSVFEEGDAEVMRERIEIAYQTLRDPESRQAYDADLTKQVEADADGADSDAMMASDPASLATSVAPSAETLELELEELGEIDDHDESCFDGPRLRRSRLRAGVELEEIAGVTKVNPTYLRFIEEERFDDLPAAVYVRGFVMGYASCVGLDPRRVADSYMPRYQESRGADPKRRRFSRR